MTVKRTVLQSLPIPEMPGWELRMVMLEYPGGTVAPLHTHPEAGTNYVVEGEVISQWEGDDKPERFGVGDTFIDLKDKPHTRAENASKDKPLKMLAHYVIRVGQPNVVMS